MDGLLLLQVLLGNNDVAVKGVGVVNVVSHDLLVKLSLVTHVAVWVVGTRADGVRVSFVLGEGSNEGLVLNLLGGWGGGPGPVVAELFLGGLLVSLGNDYVVVKSKVWYSVILGAIGILPFWASSRVADWVAGGLGESTGINNLGSISFLALKRSAGWD